MRIREPKTTALIFASGKVIIRYFSNIGFWFFILPQMIVTGAKSTDESVTAARKYKEIIVKCGFPAKFTEFKIQNMTATCDVGFPIRLEGLIYAHASNATYEPELFPGLVYRMTDPKVVLLIFVSGKVVITGAKNAEALGAAVENIFDHLVEFRKKNIVVSAL